MVYLPVLLVLELFIGVTMTRFFGFIPTALAYIVPTFLGFTFFSFQNQMIMMQFQRQMAAGKAPDRELLTLMAKFISTILLIIPSMMARGLALLLIFPLTRYLFIFMGRNWLASKIQNGSFKIFGAGGRPGFGTGTHSYRTYDFEREMKDVTPEREAKVIPFESLQAPKKNQEPIP